MCDACLFTFNPINFKLPYLSNSMDKGSKGSIDWQEPSYKFYLLLPFISTIVFLYLCILVDV
jgi:hypothetical protein